MEYCKAVTGLPGAIALSMALSLNHPAAYGQAAGGATQAQASGATAAANVDVLEEVTVTAQRQVENLQKVGIAVTSVSADTFAQLGGGDVSSLALVAPNLQTNSNGGNGELIGIRGIITGNGTDVGDPAVAFETDGLYFARSGTQGSPLYDVDHIEVLRGPQGTLYGRNATTGVINVISKTPTQDYTAEGYVEAGDYSQLNAFAVLNAPLSDNAAVRGAFISTNHGAVFQNDLSTGENYGDRHENAGRLTATYKPTDDISILVRGSMDQEQDHGYPSQVSIPLSRDPFSFPMQYSGDNYQRQYIAQAIIDWKLPIGTLTYDGGFHDSYAYAKAQIPGAPVILYADPTTSRSQQHELRLADTTDHFKYVVGLYYFDEFQSWDIYVDPAVTFLMPHEYDGSRAAYGQATWSVTDELRLTGGLRYTADQKDRLGQNDAYAPGDTLAEGEYAPLVLLTPDVGKVSSSKLNYKVGLDYDLARETMVYGSVSTGYKQGGFFDGNGLTFNNTYKPENVTSYEIGLKSRFLDDRVQTNLAAFYYKYSDFQVSFQNAELVTETYNAQLARNEGLEAEIETAPSANDRLGGSLTYLHARYAQFDIPGGPDIYGNSSYSGNTLPYAPDWGINLHWGHNWNVSADKVVSVSALGHWQSSEYLDFHDFAPTRQPSYWRGDFNLGWGDAKGRFMVTAYARNVGTKYVLVSAALPSNVSNPDAAATGTLMMPLLVGVRVDFKIR